MLPRVPAEVFPPGEFLKEELEARDLTASDLAEIMGRPPAVVSEILAGRRRITPETAKGLAAALETTAELWMNLDAAYQLSLVREDKYDSISKRSQIYQLAPIKEMIRRGWIEPSDNVEVLAQEVMTFLGISSLDEEPEEPDIAARKSTSYDLPSSPAQRAWAIRSRQVCQSAPLLANFSQKRFEELLPQLKLYMTAPQETRHVPRALAEAGIRFAVVEPLKGGKIDGACFWQSEIPSVVVSTRFDRIDHFWFVLMHELGHVKEKATSFDIDLVAASKEENRREEETRADRFAEEQLVPSTKLDSFIARTRPLYSMRRIQAFSNLLAVHPGIVVGQLQHRRELSFGAFRRQLEPVREFLVESAITDGWGSTLPLSSVIDNP